MVKWLILFGIPMLAVIAILLVWAGIKKMGGDE